MNARFRLLGPVEGVRDGVPLSLGGSKQKTVLATLLLDGGRSVSTNRLLEAVWGDEPGDGAVATLRVLVSNLRRIIAAGQPDAIIYDGHGYRCRFPCDLDVLEFEEQCRVAELAPPEVAARAWRQALALFRGEPLSGLEHTEPIRREQVRLAEARAAAVDAMFTAELAAGRHREVLPELFVAVDEQPLREQLRSMLIVALYRSGRQADALRSYRQLRDRMVDELGIEPSPDMRRLEQLVLDQSEELDVAPVGQRRAPSTIDIRAVAPDARLVLEDGRTIMLSRRVTVIGREASADIAIDDRRVSRQHAVIRSRQGRFELVDDGSTNGTEANGQSVERHDLHSGDVISLGGYVVRFLQ